MTIRELSLKTRAASLFMDRGLDGLRAWYRSLSEADQALLADFVVQPGSIPVDVETEPEETEPEVVEEKVIRKPAMFIKCPECEAEQLILTGRCWACGYKEVA